MKLSALKTAEDAISARVDRTLEDLLFAGAIKPNIFVIIASAMIAAFAYSVSGDIVLYWLAYMQVLAIFRLFIERNYRKKIFTHLSAEKYQYVYIGATMLIGLGWGLISCFPNLLINPFHVAIVFMLMMGVVFLGIMILSMNFSVMLCYCSFFPFFFIAELLYMHNPYGFRYATIIFFAWLFMTWVGWQQHQRLRQEITTRIKNADLILLLEKSNFQIQQASRAKTDFLANMSHEIRTPMNGILGMTRLVLDMELGMKQRKLLGNVMYSAESLLGIINDILDFSKIEAGQLALEQRDFNLELMLDNLISSFSVQAAEKNIFLKNTTDFTSVPKYINADELRLKQILVNLTGNAVKFTATGGVTISVKTVKQSEKDIILHFSVCDTGIGIDPDKHKSIFDSFKQADSSTVRKYGGTGLGLAISNQLVKMMNGSMGIESRKGQGSKFYFTIAAGYGKEMKSKEDLSFEGSNHQNLRVLIVEDNEINQELIKIILEQDGQNVTIADNGLEALEILGEKDFDLILMDMQMPEMDGITATVIIRNCESGKTDITGISSSITEKISLNIQGGHIPIIAMTANVLDRDRQKCAMAGMDGYMTKPFAPEALYKELNKLAIPKH